MRSSVLGLVMGCCLLAGATVGGSSVRPGPHAQTVRQLRGMLREAEQALTAGRLHDAEGLFARSVERARILGRTNLLLARALDGLGDVQRLGGRPAEARASYLESVQVLRAVLGPRQPRVATTLHNLGAVCVELGRTEDAVAHLGEALSIWEATRGPSAAETRNTRRALERAARAPRGPGPN